MADAFFYASEGRRSYEIEFLRSVERFGLEAMTGRKQFYYGEYRKMIIAENVVNSYRSRAQSKVWNTWASLNPQMAELLELAENIAHGEQNTN